MTRRSKGTLRSDLQRKLSRAHRDLVARTRALTNADSEFMKKAGAILQKHIREQLSTPAAGLRVALQADAKGRRRMYGEPSAPGESPRRITGALRRGIKNKVVEGERQVRAENFRSKILEFGFVSAAAASRPQQYQVFGTRERKRQGMTKAKVARSMEPRPFMRPGYEAAKGDLAKGGAAILRDEVQRHGVVSSVLGGGRGD